MEEKINQILKNQIVIMSTLQNIDEADLGDLYDKMLQTQELLNPPQEQSHEDKTKEVFEE